MNYAMLSVDLSSVSSEQRNQFNEYLGKEKWAKTENITTVWTAPFNEDVSFEGAVRMTKNDVQKAAEYAKIPLSSINAVVHIGSNKPVRF